MVLADINSYYHNGKDIGYTPFKIHTPKDLRIRFHYGEDVTYDDLKDIYYIYNIKNRIINRGLQF